MMGIAALNPSYASRWWASRPPVSVCPRRGTVDSAVSGRFQQRLEHRFKRLAAPAREGAGPSAVVHQRLQPAAGGEYAVGQAHFRAAGGDGVLQLAQAVLVAGF